MKSACPEIVINGERHPLKLTLGALAKIEDAVGGGDFEALKRRLEAPRVSDLILILHALIGGGGGAPLAMEVLRESDVDLGEASIAIAEAFTAIAEPGKAPDQPGAAGQMEAPEKPQKGEEAGGCHGATGSHTP